MLSAVFNKKNSQLLSAIVMLLLAMQPVRSQRFVRTKDTTSKTISDTLLPGLIIKVASYTATIDHTDFLIRRKFNITPISLNIPEIERKVKGFKSRLETRGSQMNLRSLNSGIIMLNEIAGKLTSYQKILINFSSQLTESNIEVKKILRDPVLNMPIPDSILQEQLEDIRLEGHELDSLQQKRLAQVNLLRNKVSVNLLQSTDIISDMRYLTISLRLGMWNQEDPPLFNTKQIEYKNDLIENTATALQRSGLIISIYLNDKWNVVTFGLILFIFIFSWTFINMRQMKKQQNSAAVFENMFFLNRNVLLCCLMAFFTYLPFLFANPPMSFLHFCELFRLVMLTSLLYPYLVKQSRILWVLISLLWVYYALDDILLESSFGERWGLFFAGILLVIISVKIITDKRPYFIKLSESPAAKALVIFTLTQVAFSIVFNITGRVSLAKILGVSAIQTLVLGISLKVFSTMVLEVVYLQSEAYSESRFTQFIDFNNLKQRLLRILWIISLIIWIVSFMRNLTLYDEMLNTLSFFFNETRTIGSMVFTFKNVAVFIFIIWLSSVISGIINFFFGNGKVSDSTNRTRIGSMMLLIRLTIWTLGFSIAVAAAGIPLDKLSLMLGALGVGIGFGLQNIVNNLVSGVIIAFERPIQVGDLIEVGGKTGVVKEIGVRSSKINNNEGADIIVPNGDLLSQHLINWTMQDRNRQVEFLIGIPYQADLKTVRTSIQETLMQNEKIMKSPAPAIVIQQFDDWAIKMKILFWVYDLGEAGSIRSNVMIEIYEMLAGMGIQLPVYKGLPAEQPVQ